MQACNVQPENISAYHFGYVLGPCVNATGRLDTARHALRLFETGQETEAEEIARDLVDLNQERKELTLQGVEMAKNSVRKVDMRMIRYLFCFCRMSTKALQD